MICYEKALIKLEFAANYASEVRATEERVTWRSVIKKSSELEMKQRDSTRLARHRTRHRSNTQIKNTRIYVVRQYAYIHWRRQGESFTKKIGRLQQWYQDSLKEPKPQLHPNLSLTKNKPRKTLL